MTPQVLMFEGPKSFGSSTFHSPSNSVIFRNRLLKL